ncbi:MAG TPA: hypothetical protein VMZ53_16910 [Kofleriaceae bacterium]|nr:hypothetical protein [Kofleriaceae bacterium]
MQRAVLATIIVTSACGPSGRDGNGDLPDARPSGDGQVTLPASRVYAHSGSKLYQVDSQPPHTPVEIGTMGGIGTQSLTDLAIDKTDRMVGITLDKLYTINPTTGAATLVTDLSTTARGFTSLSFVPADINNPSSADILVSANDQGDVYSIDAMNGNATKIGSYGSVSAGKVISSGDLIGVQGLGIYATVDVGTQPNDYLARIDPTTWKATPIGTASTGYDNIFGLAFWEGKIYGFVSAGTDAGKIITIDPTTGVGTQVQSGAVRWYGAGVATDAPIIQ